MGETDEERRARKERERAERKAREAGAGESPESKKETDEERRARKERERAERKAREAGAGESPEPKKETDEERRARKERERAERKAREAGAGESPEPKKETDEERRARKERERAERKAREAGAGESSEPKKETDEERRARKERERAERKAREAGAGESPEPKKETDEERRARKERERAERRARETEVIGSGHNSSAAARAPSGPRPVSKHQALIDAIDEENRVATSRGSNAAAVRLGGGSGSPAVSPEDQDRERRREERRLRKEKKQVEVQERKEGDAGKRKPAEEVNTYSLERQGYRQQFDKDLARATALRRLVDFDDFSVVVVDIAPQSEYDMYIRQFGQGKTAQVGTRAPEVEYFIDAEVQAERSKKKHQALQAPDDLGLYPEQYADRQRLVHGNAGDSEEDESHHHQDNQSAVVGSPMSPPTGFSGFHSNAGGSAVGADAGLLGSFLNRVFPLVSALLDENSAGGNSDAKSTRAKSSTSFSSNYTTLSYDAVKHRPVLQTRFSITNPQSMAALYGPSTAAGPSPGLDAFSSVVLQWNTHDSFHPERALVSFTPLTCLCFSPSRPHLLYAGTEDGCVCVWDTREPDRHHLHAGQHEGLVFRLPSYSTTWKADNHSFPVSAICVAGYNTVVGVRREEFEQLVSLDRSGQTKFWAMNEKSHAGKEINDHDHGLHMFSQVRLYLTSTRDASGTIPLSSSGATPYVEATALDFSPSDASQFVIAVSDGLFHTNRFGSACAPACYAPTSTLFGSDVPSPMPLCVQYSLIDSRLLVAGYDDGTVRLFLHTESQPQLTVALVGMMPIRDVRFTGTRWHTWVLDDGGTLHLLDHAHKNRDQPMLSQTMSQPDVGNCISMDVPGVEKTDSRLLALGFEKGIVQLHTLDHEKLQIPAADRDEQWL